MPDTLIASPVLKAQKGKQLSHALNRLQHQNTHQHKAAASAAHQLMSVAFVQRAVEKSFLKETAPRENTSDYSWHRALQLRTGQHVPWRNTQEENQRCLFLSNAPSLLTTNTFKDFSESWERRAETVSSCWCWDQAVSFITRVPCPVPSCTFQPGSPGLQEISVVHVMRAKWAEAGFTTSRSFKYCSQLFRTRNTGSFGEKNECPVRFWTNPAYDKHCSPVAFNLF